MCGQVFGWEGRYVGRFLVGRVDGMAGDGMMHTWKGFSV